MNKTKALGLPSEVIERKIYLIRGQRVMLDSDLALLYGVPAYRLIEAIKRNKQRFPEDFMFQLNVEEWRIFMRRFVISSEKKGTSDQTLTNLRSQNAISSSQRSGFTVDSYQYGGRRTLPYCFTEQGVTMLSAVLRSPRAIAVSIEVVRTFVKLRQMLSSNLELARRLAALEEKYDEQFKVVFDAIRELMAEPKSTKKTRIGFGRE